MICYCTVFFCSIVRLAEICSFSSIIFISSVLALSIAFLIFIVTSPFCSGMLMISFAAVYEFVISVNTDRNVILFQILGIVINY